MNFRRKTIWIGLGNPGPDYERTYHNAGQLVLDHFERTLTKTMAIAKEGAKRLFEFKVFEPDPGHSHGYGHSERIALVRPRTFMNESGKAVKAALARFKAKPEHLLIFQDDSDLPLGSFRISANRGAGGHHGIESIIAHLGTKNFTRIRIGIRPPRETSRAKAATFVLRKVSAPGAKMLQSVVSAIESVIENDNP